MTARRPNSFVRNNYRAVRPDTVSGISSVRLLWAGTCHGSLTAAASTRTNSTSPPSGTSASGQDCRTQGADECGTMGTLQMNFGESTPFFGHFTRTVNDISGLCT